MSAETKAKKFVTEAERHGWEHKIEIKGDEAHVYCTREAERLYIWWRGDTGKLIETPKYTFGGHTISTHNAAGAYRQLAAKPDLSKVYRRSQRIRISSGEEEGEIPVVRHTLPFDIDESSDKEILREIRGSRLTWLNRQTGMAEMAQVPYKVTRSGSVILMNTDLKNVFYLAAGNDDRAYVSFMDGEGRFRAVYLDNILQVS